MVVDGGSLSAAARAQGLSVAAVSRQVRALEEEFGAPLLVRSTRALALTEAGGALHERARRILEEVEQARGAVKTTRAVRGLVRVSAPVTLGMMRVVPALPALFTRYAALQVDLRLEDRNADLAAFHAAQALIVESTGTVATSHQGVHAEVHRLSRDEPAFDPDSRRLLSQAYSFKAVADDELGPDAEIPRNGPRRLWTAPSPWSTCRLRFSTRTGDGAGSPTSADNPLRPKPLARLRREREGSAPQAWEGEGKAPPSTTTPHVFQLGPGISAGDSRSTSRTSAASRVSCFNEAPAFLPGIEDARRDWSGLGGDGLQ